MNEKPIESFYPTGKRQWRKWLQQNHDKKQSVWIICYKRESGVPTLSWIVLAKRKETREKRISDIAEHGAQGKKPKQF